MGVRAGVASASLVPAIPASTVASTSGVGWDCSGTVAVGVGSDEQASRAKAAVTNKIMDTILIGSSFIDRTRRNDRVAFVPSLPRIQQLAQLDEGLVADAALDGYAAGRDSQFQLLDDLWAAGGGAGDG